YWDTAYKPGDYLVFGRESAGLPPEFYDRYRDLLRLIPMPGPYHRSLNLANSVGIVLYEAMRQNR
ncbi:MAG: TrmH family RNA methyltransferase, partial [Victivallaceae bacterium]|nr:TrmH family RNA methyltransferase [Victivallaceae bacterium]